MNTLVITIALLSCVGCIVYIIHRNIQKEKKRLAKLKEKNAKGNLLISIYDIIPLIHEKLGKDCPSDDILKVILNIAFKQIVDAFNQAFEVHEKGMIKKVFKEQ